MRESRDYTVQDVLSVFFHRLPLWIFLFILAGAAVVAVQFFTKDRMTISTVVNFSYDGIESGRDPAGTRFNEQEMKSEAMVRQAAGALARAVSAEDVEAIQSAIEIRGNIPSSVFDNIIDYESIYGSSEIETMESIRETSYFPAQYTLTFYYTKAGFSAKQGALFLQELLNAYEQYFYDRYGYNSSLENSVSSIDYEEYDYINAVDVLNDRLTSLRSYLAALAVQDNTRFVSTHTGYSFSDLLDAIDTIRNEDVSWVTSYIVSNNITKNRQDLIDYYQYRIEDAGRELAQRESRLYTLNTQIEGYVKTTAVFLGVVDPDSTEQGASNYEYTQQSQMYDTLINEKVSCETAISDTQERIALYRQRAERLLTAPATGVPALVEANLERIDGKVKHFLEITRETADDYFRTVWLKRGFQVLEEPESTPITGLLIDAFPFVLIVEAALFGLLVLRVPAAARSEAQKKREASERTEYDRVPVPEEEQTAAPVGDSREAVAK